MRTRLLILLLATACSESVDSGDTTEDGDADTVETQYEFMGVCFESDEGDCESYNGKFINVYTCDSWDTTGDFLDCALGKLNDLGEDGWYIIEANTADISYGIASGRVLLMQRLLPPDE